MLNKIIISLLVGLLIVIMMPLAVWGLGHYIYWLLGSAIGLAAAYFIALLILGAIGVSASLLISIWLDLGG